jgi:hypothetical protein
VVPEDVILKNDLMLMGTGEFAVEVISRRCQWLELTVLNDTTIDK